MVCICGKPWFLQEMTLYYTVNVSFSNMGIDCRVAHFFKYLLLVDGFIVEFIFEIVQDS